MRTCIFLYEGSVMFEIVLAAYLMKTVGEVSIISDSKNSFKTFEGFTINPDYEISELEITKIDLLIITGGDSENIKDLKKLENLILNLHQNKKIIAGICSGKNIIQKLGLVKKNENILGDVVIENNIILSESNSYVDFAIEIGKKLEIYRDEDDLNETINYFKYFKNI